jgi:hypothetical protein
MAMGKTVPQQRLRGNATATLPGCVAITDIVPDGKGAYDVSGIARPYQAVTVQSFDAEGDNPSDVVDADQVSDCGWLASGVQPGGASPWCFLAQGQTDGASGSTMYDDAEGMFAKVIKVAKAKKTSKPR